MPKESSDLKAKLKKVDTQVKDYISELEARNAKRQRAIVKLEADKMERDNRIKALQEEMKKLSKIEPLIVNITRFDPKLTHGELEALLFKTAQELGYRLEKIQT